MNIRPRALLVIFLFLVAQLACRSPLPGQSGAASQPAGPIYTLTSLPPFPTATATPLPSPTVTITSSPTLTRTPTRTATLPPTLPARLTFTPNPRPALTVFAPYLYTPPKINGDWSEWKNLTEEYPAKHVVWGREQWTSPEDLSSSYHIGWDDNFLYLAMKVRDDLYVQNAHGANLYNGDSLELLLDTQLMEDYKDTRLSNDDFQLGISPGRPHPRVGQEAYLWFPNWLAGEQKSVKIEARQEDGIYRIEAAIPWVVFQMKPEAGKHYGFVLSVSDNDNGDSGVQQTMISNLPERHPGDPTTWGVLQLVK
ncbi:MAG: hypothetical protein EHM21_03640 [Chloroflexi bacterium]|nr:MAG: hypothetical protein EHM21_03640 [Chloroflexota bacterium]